MMLAVMKMLKNLLFTLILLVGCSLVAFGQSNDNRGNPPPKKDPPVVPVEPKKTPAPTPKPQKPPKKPESQLIGGGAVSQVLIG